MPRRAAPDLVGASEAPVALPGRRTTTRVMLHQPARHAVLARVAGKRPVNAYLNLENITGSGLHGTYHSVSEQHLQRYVNEFDFRWNHRAKLGVDDVQRTAAILKGIEGKRLTYRA